MAESRGGLFAALRLESQDDAGEPWKEAVLTMRGHEAVKDNAISPLTSVC